MVRRPLKVVGVPWGEGYRGKPAPWILGSLFWLSLYPLRPPLNTLPASSVLLQWQLKVQSHKF